MTTYAMEKERQIDVARTQDEKVITALKEMLSYRRPARSSTELEFINRFIRPLNPEEDRYGNLIVRVPKPDGSPSSVLWSCHTDTVSRVAGRQSVNEEHGWMYTTDDASTCLGADDTIGCFLMIGMALHKVPGLYVFHRDEEIGGLGSQFIADNTRSMIAEIKAAIAFDRRGRRSVITHQGCSRCCSDAFAQSLATQLNLAMGLTNELWKLDDGGIFTDTANYTAIIPECTNLSVGYFQEHSVNEHVDAYDVSDLLSALLQFDESRLMISRDPGEIDPDDYHWTGYMRDANDEVTWKNPIHPVGSSSSNYEELLELVKKYPEAVADWLDGYGATAADIRETIY